MPLEITTIPHARGLQQELEARVQNLVVAAPIEEMAPDGIHQVTSYELFDGDERLGRVLVNTYDRFGVHRVAGVEYTGRVPGYVNSITGLEEISLTALEVKTLDVTKIAFEHWGVSGPNNTPSEPLYRHDGHLLRLADHEVDGKSKVLVR